MIASVKKDVNLLPKPPQSTSQTSTSIPELDPSWKLKIKRWSYFGVVHSSFDLISHKSWIYALLYQFNLATIEWKTIYYLVKIYNFVVKAIYQYLMYNSLIGDVEVILVQQGTTITSCEMASDLFFFFLLYIFWFITFFRNYSNNIYLEVLACLVHL